jgi:subtilisin family serine protease
LPGYAEDQLQVELVPGTNIDEVNAEYGTTTLDSIPPLYLLQLPAGSDEDEYLDRMRGDMMRFRHAEYAYNDETPEGTRQMVVAAVGGTIDDYLDQNLVARIHLPEILAHQTGEGVLVAVLDTGVRADHPALEGVVEPGYDFVADDADPADEANGLDDDGDALIDEGAGHGTMVAGIIHLVAPGARIPPIRVLDDEGQGTTFTLAAGIRYAVEHGAAIINLSLGLTERSEIVTHELCRARNASIPMAAAAGNLGTDTLQYFPASDPSVLMIAALDSSDVKADFSSYGPDVDLSAPGVGILVPWWNGEYAIGAGTSFATPFISGQCALALGFEPQASYSQVYDWARGGVVDIYAVPGNEIFIGMLGTGRVDGLETLYEFVDPAASPPLPTPASAEPAWSIFPNPAPSLSQVRIGRPRDADSMSPLIILDALGRRVQTLGPTPGATGSVWDLRDLRGRPVPAGVYMVITSGSRAPAGRVHVLR